MTIKGGFEIAHNRYVCVLSQWLPAILIKFGTPLKAVAVAYSWCYSLAPVLMALLALHWLKRPYTALAILLLVTLMNSLLFYYTVSELQMDLALLILYDGILDRYAIVPSRKRWPILFLSSILIVPAVAFAHPMSLPVFGCWVVYRAIRRDRDLAMLGLEVAFFVAALSIKESSSFPAMKRKRDQLWTRQTTWGSIITVARYPNPSTAIFFRKRFLFRCC